MLLTPGGSTDDMRLSQRLRGDLLGGSPYRFMAELGAGGMGEVLEAEHRTLGHRVVVKVMREELARRPEMFDRMRVEAQSLARIRHPNLVMVTDFGHTPSGRPFLVMERLEGRSLQEELHRRATVPVAEAAEIGRQMLLGLSAAHAAGLVHRDIKPDNVFLCASEDGRPQVKVLDFGVVKIAQAGRDPRTPQPPAVPTAENITLGTPRYFSPEQTYGARDLDARSDLYSVGLVLYRMVVGHGPFDQYRRWQDLFLAHTSERPMPPSASAPQVVPALFERIVMRALAKKREERFPDAVAFAEELSRFLSSLGAEGHRVNATVQLPEDEQETLEQEENDDVTGPGAAATPDDLDTDRMVAAGPGETGASATEEPTATASPIVGRKGDVAPAGRLSDGPVMIDHLVSRVLGSAVPTGGPPGRRTALPVQGAAPQTELFTRGAAGRTTPITPGAAGRTDPLASLPVPASRASSPGWTDVVVPALPAAATSTEPMPTLSAPPAGRTSRPGIPETAPMFEVAHVAPAARPSTPGAAPASTPLQAFPPAPPASAAWKAPVLASAAVLLVLLGALLGDLLR